MWLSARLCLMPYVVCQACGFRAYSAAVHANVEVPLTLTECVGAGIYSPAEVSRAKPTT